MKKVFLVILLSVSILSVFGQRDNEKWYLNGVGMRCEFGASSNGMLGLNLDHFFGTRFSMEANCLTDFYDCYEAALRGKLNLALPNVNSHIRWFTGFGFLGGLEPRHDKSGEVIADDPKMYLGPSISLGIGCNIPKIPVNITFEWCPTWNIMHKEFSNHDKQELLKSAILGVTLRYITSNKY